MDQKLSVDPEPEPERTESTKKSNFKLLFFQTWKIKTVRRFPGLTFSNQKTQKPVEPLREEQRDEDRVPAFSFVYDSFEQRVEQTEEEERTWHRRLSTQTFLSFFSVSLSVVLFFGSSPLCYVTLR